MWGRSLWLVLVLATRVATADAPLPNAKPIPLLQVVPHAGSQIAIEREGRELSRYHFGETLRRPFLFPLIGPSGKSLTRIGHPRDPHTHSHHNSVWIAHHDVDGVDFWSDHGKNLGTVVTKRPVRYEDGDDAALAEFELAWQNNSGATLVHERRTTRWLPLPDREYLVVIDIELTAPKGKPTTLGKTPFGLVGVRMAKTIGVNDGGGTIRNSQGHVDEPEVHWKRARWVDYSGPIAKGVNEGITLLDHPDNPNHPTYFHVRNDGWMGASLTYDAPRRITAEEPLRLRYGLWVHAGVPSAEAIDKVFATFSKVDKPASSR